MTELDDLRSGIRAKILAGDLPKEHCQMTWFGPGRRAICVACDQVIGPDEVEVECDLPEGGGDDQVSPAVLRSLGSGMARLRCMTVRSAAQTQPSLAMSTR
jgi:hypothetical protein